MSNISLPRRRVLLWSACAVALGPGAALGADRFASSPWRALTAEQWRRRLPAAAYHILREEGTEPPGSSPLLKEHRKGTFACRGCGLPLFRSDWKFESGTGWPSFYRVIRENIGRKADRNLAEPRIEYHCARCLGHQGHVFDDGPKPTGLRYCNDGLALKFIPAKVG